MNPTGYYGVTLKRSTVFHVVCMSFRIISLLPGIKSFTQNQTDLIIISYRVITSLAGLLVSVGKV